MYLILFTLYIALKVRLIVRKIRLKKASWIKRF
jgi:hypothetical protein